MGTEDLEQRKAAIEDRFNDLANSKTEIETEMTRLQGEHRLVVDLLTPTIPILDEAKPVKRIRKVAHAQDRQQ